MELELLRVISIELLVAVTVSVTVSVAVSVAVAVDPEASVIGPVMASGTALGGGALGTLPLP